MAIDTNNSPGWSHVTATVIQAEPTKHDIPAQWWPQATQTSEIVDGSWAVFPGEHLPWQAARLTHSKQTPWTLVPQTSINRGQGLCPVMVSHLPSHIHWMETYRPNCKPSFFSDLIMNSIFPRHGIPYDTIDTILSLAFPSHGIPYDTIDLILNPAFAIHGLPYEIIHIIISPAFPSHGIWYAAIINPHPPSYIAYLLIHERVVHTYIYRLMSRKQPFQR